MEISLWLNNVFIKDNIAPNTLLLDYVRSKGCYSVKRGCETSNCGLCTVILEGKPVLSCSTLAVRANGKHVITMEGLQEEAAEVGGFLADQGSEQCGFCSPGFIMNVISMSKELKDPTLEEVKGYLAGNLCRCTGYQSQLRAVLNYLNAKKEAK
ncbi:(2Fe-2S)-binding protein [Anaerocolumna aminovalerica]|uniref:(2Fe-2S)-binding protein n=1 Tax=Anaerocolumna aminovalerica TaxID=1527 RepID=UPI000BE2F9DF|nr:2Fe-2S iron-sulfur cluster-binding protein [Anaerocolumna aminovalerica]